MRLDAIVIQPDGRILVAGRAFESGDKAALVRYLANGDLDTSFTSSGILLVSAEGAG